MRFFVISRIIKGEVSVISRSLRPRLITLAENIILLCLAEHRLILSNSAYGIVAFVSGNNPRIFAGYNS